MKQYIVVLISLFIISCKQNIHRIEYEGNYVEGNIEIVGRDTIFNGPIKYYDSSNHLLAIQNFENGLKNGRGIRYSSNGIDSMKNYYYYGLQHGQSYYYHLGKLEMCTYYYYGRQMGPRIYNNNDNPYYFRFSDFNQTVLYECKYVKDSVSFENGSLTKYITDYIEENGVEKLHLFIPIIEPPGKKVSYILYNADLKTNNASLVKEFSSKDGFFQDAILSMPDSNHRYFLRTEVYVVKKDVTRFHDEDLIFPAKEN